MKIAIVNAFPKMVFSAEKEFINRCISVLSAMGHEGRAIAWSDEINDFDPDFVVVTHEYVPKLTDHYTVGVIWSPTVFTKNEPERIKAIRSWDLAVPLNAATREFARDVRFPGLVARDVSEVDFYPSCQDFEVETPDAGRLSLAYVGVHWDGFRHKALIEALAEKVDLNIYGPPHVWAHLPDHYRGTIPFDGKSMGHALNKHGAVLAIHKEEHRADNIPSMRVFEACAARCLVFTEALQPIVDLFGDSPVYLDLAKNPEETADDIARALRESRAHPLEFRRRVEASHAAFKSKASLEINWLNLINDVAVRKPARHAAYVARQSDATVSVIIRCGSRPLEMVRRAAESVVGQTYRDLGIIFVRFAEIDGFQEYVDALRTTGRLAFVRVVEARGGGVRSAALWAGFQSVETPFFAVLDDDDALFATHFSDLVRILDKEASVDFVYSGVVQCEEDDLRHLRRDDDAHNFNNRVRIQMDHPRFQGDSSDMTHERRTLCFFDDFDLDRLLRYDNFIQSNTWVGRRKCLTELVLDDPGLEAAEDFYLLLLLASRFKFAFSGTVSAVWNWRSENWDNSMRSVTAKRWAHNVERIERRLAQIEFDGYPGHSVLRRGRGAPASPPPIEAPEPTPLEVQTPAEDAAEPFAASAPPESLAPSFGPAPPAANALIAARLESIEEAVAAARRLKGILSRDLARALRRGLRAKLFALKFKYYLSIFSRKQRRATRERRRVYKAFLREWR